MLDLIPFRCFDLKTQNISLHSNRFYLCVAVTWPALVPMDLHIDEIWRPLDLFDTLNYHNPFVCLCLLP